MSQRDQLALAAGEKVFDSDETLELERLVSDDKESADALGGHGPDDQGQRDDPNRLPGDGEIAQVLGRSLLCGIIGCSQRCTLPAVASGWRSASGIVEATIVRMPRTSVSWGTLARSARYTEPNAVVTPRPLRTDEYRRLLALRTGLRQFLHWSQEQARAAGLTPAQHQLLLAVRGHGEPQGPTISDIAGYLLLRHHSAVELAQRAEAAGFVERRHDPHDGRMVRLALTRKGSAALGRLSAQHVEELARLADDFRPLWEGLDATDSQLISPTTLGS